jgi:hypothetical protein
MILSFYSAFYSDYCKMLPRDGAGTSKRKASILGNPRKNAVVDLNRQRRMSFDEKRNREEAPEKNEKNKRVTITVENDDEVAIDTAVGKSRSCKGRY